jgi:MFS family permease
MPSTSSQQVLISCAHLWRSIRPPNYLLFSLCVAIGGLLNGLDTGCIGPIITLPSFVDSFGDLSPSLRGPVVSSVLLPATFTLLFAGIVSDKLGRYVCEISPPKQRGPLATMLQLLITVGLCLGFFTCYGTVNIPTSLAWRLPFALQAGFAIVLAGAAQFYLPHSPRWLTYQGRHNEVVAMIDKLSISNTEHEKDLLEQAAATGNQPVTLLGRTTSADGPRLLSYLCAEISLATNMFRKDARKLMFLGVFIIAMQQLSGIDGVIYISKPLGSILF